MGVKPTELSGYASTCCIHCVLSNHVKTNQSYYKTIDKGVVVTPQIWCNYLEEYTGLSITCHWHVEAK